MYDKKLMMVCMAYSCLRALKSEPGLKFQVPNATKGSV